MDRQTAITLVTAQCQASIYPLLSSTEIGTLVDATAGFVTWQASTSYAYGTVTQPTVRNGHLYKCIVGGTSGTTEPFWPLYTAPDLRVGLTQPHWHGFQGMPPRSEVSDGTVLWLEFGPDTNGAYNARLATYNGWMQKAAKASADYDVSVDQDRLYRSQVYQNCLMMAARYAPSGIF